MVNDRYIWCRSCGAIHRVTQFDRSPIYALAGGEGVETPANDWRDFMDRHAGHKLEPLVATGDDYSPKGARFDPMSVRYIEVSNGAETLLLRRSRSSIEEPVCYEIVDGRVVQTGLSLEVQADAIRKEMKLHFRWAPAAPMEDEKIAHFVSIFREVVSEIDAHGTRATEYSDTDPNVTYCALDSGIIDKLMAKCSRYFHPDEINCLRRFVESHRDGGDVMALVKRRVLSVEPRAGRVA
jgi:hypothetical protein